MPWSGKSLLTLARCCGSGFRTLVTKLDRYVQGEASGFLSRSQLKGGPDEPDGIDARWGRDES
jgi:hypothetical protein